MSDQSDSGARRRSKRCLYPAPRRPAIVMKTGLFSKEEKELVLSALHSYGPNVDKLTPLLPGRSKEQVRDFLTSWYRRVRKVPVVLSDKDNEIMLIKEPIEKWLNKIKKEMKTYASANEGSTPYPWYPYALGYIAKYENHPHLSETGGVDFKKLYEYLEFMLQGNAPKDLGFMDAVFMMASLRRLKLRLEKVDFHKDEWHMKRAGSSQISVGQPRTYKRVRKQEPVEDQSQTDVESLLKTRMMNPLGMPVENLSIKERLKS